MKEITGYDFSGVQDIKTRSVLHQFVADVYVSLLRLREKPLTMEVILGNAWNYDLYLVIPFDCEIVKVWSVLQGPTAAAAETITLYNHAGTASTGGAITIAAGSVIGEIDYCTPTNNNQFQAGDKVKVHIGSENSNTVRCDLTFLCKVG